MDVRVDEAWGEVFPCRVDVYCFVVGVGSFSPCLVLVGCGRDGFDVAFLDAHYPTWEDLACDCVDYVDVYEDVGLLMGEFPRFVDSFRDG